MQTLRQHELFEIEVLENLAKAGFLGPLVFGGGTMLRLCHELPRYSVDLDFWFSKKIADTSSFYKKLLDHIKRRYQVTDSKNKRFTLLVEFRGNTSPKKLKIEIRKEFIKKGVEDKIAYSKYGSTQVLVRALSLEEMANRKLLAIRARTEIRDYFDLEFLLRREASMRFSDKDKAFIKRQIGRFKQKDYRVVLGSILEKDLRDYYIKNEFTYLLEKITL